ncbi:MAG: hypothetical protein OMM_03837 [Candidatus Magnetoglobus multicellularis str. Araruama]|uniref:Uncharacterized protein n=1 Tax=Candidatus Magnetoglobus multicellularis str. Araruama TaxID=890399 RepID=A0A1V1P4E6_9BACT|nr:MAG: hypothetical protein OMM_03837 [Candidatus Magnetoglobus multicellularis str. Araruama]
MLGFFDIYFMKFSWVADHWQSLSLMGITSLTGAFLGFVHQQSFRIKFLTIIFTVLLVATLSVKTYNQCKKYKSESILWTDTLSCNPRSIVPHDRMALIAVAQNDYQRAQYHLQQSILIDPNNWQAHMNAGNLFNKQQQTERAKNQYLKALAIHPNRLEILINLGQLYIEEKEYESAKTYFLKALSLEPGNAYVNYQLGMLLMREGKFGEALFYFQSVIEVSPDHMASHLHMGRILSDRRPFEAIRHLNKCLLVQDIQKEAHSLLGVIYCRLCRCKQAKYHYEQAEKEFNISACCHSSKKR